MSEFKITTPGVLVEEVIGLNLASGDLLDTVTALTPSTVTGGTVEVSNAGASATAYTIRRQEFAAGSAITYKLTLSSGITTTSVTVYFAYVTVNGEELIVDRTYKVTPSIATT